MLSPRSILSFGLMLLGGNAVFGQPSSTGSAQIYPHKPVRLVTTEPGGGSDFVARLIAQGLSASFGQQVIVDNRPGGVVPGETTAKAPPDGYTMLLSGGIVWLLPSMRTKVPWDPIRDFLPVTIATTAPTILVVQSSIAANNVKELIALLRSRPGELNYSSAGAAGASHLAAELFKSMTGVNIVWVPYKGNGPALNALLSGEVQLTFAPSGLVLSHVKAGKLRALGVTSAQPSALAPELPTIAASGVPGYESQSTLGIFVPARTPTAVVNRLNQEIVKVLHDASARHKLLNAGVEAVGSTPAQLATMVKSEMIRMGNVIKNAGIRAD